MLVQSAKGPGDPVSAVACPRFKRCRVPAARLPVARTVAGLPLSASLPGPTPLEGPASLSGITSLRASAWAVPVTNGIVA